MAVIAVLWSHVGAAHYRVHLCEELLIVSELIKVRGSELCIAEHLHDSNSSA